jgi:molybdate transport system ATP-binding protein
MLSIDVERRQGDFLITAKFRQTQIGVTALFGPSGAGKTSIVNMVAGLTKPDRGNIRINGITVFDSDKGIDLRPEKRRIGYVFQDGRLFPHLSVRSNLKYGMKLIPSSQRFVDFDQVVDMLGIEHLLERRPAKLSGGEKQRVAIGRALLTNPLMLLLDEPLASLDLTRKREILPFIQRMCKEFERPILYVSHDRNEILQLASQLVVLANGRVIESAPVDTLQKTA